MHPKPSLRFRVQNYNKFLIYARGTGGKTKMRIAHIFSEMREKAGGQMLFCVLFHVAYHILEQVIPHVFAISADLFCCSFFGCLDTAFGTRHNTGNLLLG